SPLGLNQFIRCQGGAGLQRLHPPKGFGGWVGEARGQARFQKGQQQRWGRQGRDLGAATAASNQAGQLASPTRSNEVFRPSLDETPAIGVCLQGRNDSLRQRIQAVERELKRKNV